MTELTVPLWFVWQQPESEPPSIYISDTGCGVLPTPDEIRAGECIVCATLAAAEQRASELAAVLEWSVIVDERVIPSILNEAGRPSADTPSRPKGKPQ